MADLLLALLFVAVMITPRLASALLRGRSWEGVLVECRMGPAVHLPDRDDFPLTAGVSDNYFDLLPGMTTDVTLTSTATLADIKAQMKVISLTDAFGPQAGQAVVSAAK